MSIKKTYAIDCQCSNCDRCGRAELPKGKPVPGVFECPHCGCMTASKRREVMLPSWPHQPQWVPPVTITSDRTFLIAPPADPTPPQWMEQPVYPRLECVRRTN